jgi:hypothetical protein
MIAKLLPEQRPIVLHAGLSLKPLRLFAKPGRMNTTFTLSARTPVSPFPDGQSAHEAEACA